MTNQIIQLTPTATQMKQRGNRYAAAANARREALVEVNTAFRALEIAHHVSNASQSEEAMYAELDAEDAVTAAVEALAEVQAEYVEAFGNYVLAPGDAV